MNLNATQQDEAELDQELDRLRHNIMATQYLNQKLKMELQETQACIPVMEQLKLELASFKEAPAFIASDLKRVAECVQMLEEACISLNDRTKVGSYFK